MTSTPHSTQGALVRQTSSPSTFGSESSSEAHRWLWARGLGLASAEPDAGPWGGSTEYGRRPIGDMDRHDPLIARP